MFDSPLATSPYEVLGVAATASADELRRAHRARLRATHPDTGGDAALFVQVQRAWEIVGTPEGRAAFDAQREYTPSAWLPPRDTRVRAQSFGTAGRRMRGIYEGAMAGVADPYAAAAVREAPWEIRALLARALAQEATGHEIDGLGMGFTVWHDVEVRGGAIDHVVLSPSGLYAVQSLDLGGPVRLRRAEILGSDTPVADLKYRIRHLAKLAGVRFGGAVVAFPDADLQDPAAPLAGSLPTLVVGQGVVAHVLRGGVPSARRIGGVELFDIRTRLRARIPLG
ncbi:nuclease-related domain-containing protein [Microbacterium indicum]|uniref:nuclease-related domain-containing protein n=1 Tax=Microbacterium indicum TaxID=358100 RepID=UPI00042589DF|nr:nuclease-related domain-containing protein [Microbacterium indicum]